MDKYKMTIAGVERELNMFPVNEKLDIAAFIMFGDVEVTERLPRSCSKSVPGTMLLFPPRQRAFRSVTKWLVRAAVNTLSRARASRFICATAPM